MENQNGELSEIASDLRSKILVNNQKCWIENESEAKERGSDEKTYYYHGCKVESLKEILTALSDPFLPVRGHGLIALRRFVHVKHPDAVSNLDKILSIFRNQLDDEDTYILIFFPF